MYRHDTHTEATPPDGYDEAVGKAAFERLRARAEAIPTDLLRPLTLDLRRVAIVSLGVAGVLEDPQMRAQFLDLPARVFDPRHLDELRELALAAWYVRDAGLDARARVAASRVPVALVDDAVAIRTRMGKLARYHLEDEPEWMERLRPIRGGRGHKDLISDLSRLADILEANRSVVEHDRKHYRPTDVAEARRLAWELLEHIGKRSCAGRSNLSVRVWTLLGACYDKIRRAALFLFAEDPERAARFPSLYRATRAKPRDTATVTDTTMVTDTAMATDMATGSATSSAACGPSESNLTWKMGARRAPRFITWCRAPS